MKSYIYLKKLEKIRLQDKFNCIKVLYIDYKEVTDYDLKYFFIN